MLDNEAGRSHYIEVAGSRYAKQRGLCHSRQRLCRLAVVAGLAAFSMVSAVWAKEPFGMKQVINKARQLAGQPFQSSAGQVPEFLMKLDYDAWRDIRFNPEMALWKKEKLPFNVQFFHPGLYYDRTVAINIIESAKVKRVPFSSALFNYGKNNFKDKVPANLGFAGFRLHYPINTKGYFDEVAVFLGASYFRAVAKKQNYGMSARGIAIDTALNTGEEFPYFREFWMVKPVPGAKKMTIYALLDSPSMTGAYQFIIQPGKETVMDVRSTLFLRKKITKLGIAPLTSMFFYGENTSQRPADDFRPEVHDSDGLLIAFASGEWLWRPLLNPRTLLINSFRAPNPAGFGLLQRDLNFDSYQDLEAHYENRSSVWIKPSGAWGDGHVELIQIPTENELHDNISAFWVPEQMPEPGQPFPFSYTMSWHFPGSIQTPGGHVVSTRTATGKDEHIKKFVIDFAGGALESLPPDKRLTAAISVDGKARLIEQQTFKNTVTGGWRLVFQIRLEDQGSVERMLPQKKPPVELRAYLKDGTDTLTETWSYLYLP
ncbi:MAG: glucan biosynthesis protein G [Proteobacteria bacterium]|nr:glucan biosynthesis protein G [Pseudomonadota bacterium]